MATFYITLDDDEWGGKPPQNNLLVQSSLFSPNARTVFLQTWLLPKVYIGY